MGVLSGRGGVNPLRPQYTIYYYNRKRTLYYSKCYYNIIVKNSMYVYCKMYI